MSVDPEFQAEFRANRSFHVYNRTNNKEKLFLSDHDKHIFLQKFEKYLSPYLNTHAWTLIPNHFHFVIKIKLHSDVESYLNSLPSIRLRSSEKKFLKGELTLHELLIQIFRRFFQSYAVYFNKTYNRKGNLFYRSFKRTLLESEADLIRAITYAHANAKKHKLVDDFTKWQWSSWHAYVSDISHQLLKQETLEIFGGLEAFVAKHEEIVADYYQKSIEE